MKAAQLQESSTDKPIATTPYGSWFILSAAQIQNRYKTYRKLLGDVNYMFQPKEGGWLDSYFTLRDGDLTELAAGGFIEPLKNMQALLGVQPQIRTSSGVYLNTLLKHVIVDGELMHAEHAIETHKLFTSDLGGHVYDVPKDRFWIADKLSLIGYNTANRLLVWDKHHDLYGVGVKQDKILGVQSSYTTKSLDKVTTVKLLQEISQKLNLELPGTSVSHMLPNSRDHKALQFLADHPGSKRYEVYLDGLNLKQLPTPKSDADLTYHMQNMGLIKVTQYDDQDLLELSLKGKMVLAILNANKKVPLTNLFK